VTNALETRHSPTCVTLPKNFLALGQTVQRNHGDLPDNFDRLSRSLNVIGTETDRSATYDFLRLFSGNCGPILYRFEAKGGVWKIFQSPCI